MEKLLHLTLYARWYDAISAGTKRHEYRAQTQYWSRRLDGKSYTEIMFRNGYSAKARRMRVRCLGISIGEWNGQQCYVILLGQVLWRSEEDRTQVCQHLIDFHAQAQPAISHAAADGQLEAVDQS